MVTQKMIAEKLGMPVSTVANILYGTPNYKQETRERVLKTAELLGYQPNRASRALGRGRSNLIGIIHFESPYLAAREGMGQVVKAISEHGYDSLVVDSHWHEDNPDRMLAEIIQSRVEGVLLMANTDRAPESIIIDRLKFADIPVVSFLGEDYWEIPRVAGNSRQCFFSMLRHLQQVGHRSTLLMVPSYSARSTIGRIEGFQAAMKGRGPCHLLSESEFFREWPGLRKGAGGGRLGVVVRLDISSYGSDIVGANHDFANRLFALNALPDAIMCVNDRAACGVFNAAFERKICIPGDIAVTGSDNDEIGTYPMFRLTSVRYDVASSSRAAVEMLMRLLKKQRLARREVSFPGALVLRQSCGRKSGPEGPEVIVPVEPLSTAG